MTVEILALDGVTKRFAPDRSAVDGLSLSVAEGEIVALLGPSGCGKTTTLRLVAGFETPDAGTVFIRGLADRVGVLNAGRIEQLGAPEDIYHHLASQFVA